MYIGKKEPARESDVFIEYHNMRLFMRALISCRREIFTTRRDKHSQNYTLWRSVSIRHFRISTLWSLQFCAKVAPDWLFVFCRAAFEVARTSEITVQILVGAFILYVCWGVQNFGKKSFVRTSVTWSWSAHESNLQCQIWVMDGLCLKATCLQFP